MRHITLFITTLLFCTGLYAQNGTIRGTISDAQSGEVLMFTNVTVKDTDPLVGAQTDLDGKYEISIAPGMYALEVSYVGYNPKTITDVEVKADEVTVIDFPMEVAGIEIVGVEVTASAIDRTENALIQIQRKAITVQDGISAQEISRFGSNTAAGSMKRVTGASVVDGKYVFVRGLGDRYSSSQLNGLQLPSTDPYRNATQLDLIPSNLLDNIIASKTFTPDQPGNFTGGNINLKTKAFPERFTLSANIGSSFNTQSSFQDDFLTQNNGGGLGTALGFAQDFHEIPTTLGTEYNEIDARRDPVVAENLDAAAKSLNPQMAPTTTTSALNHSAAFSIGNQFNVGGNPLGILVGLNYRKSYNHYSDGIFKYWEVVSADAPLLNNRDLTDSRSVETPQLGGIANLSYKFLGTNKLSFIAIYSHVANNDNRTLSGPFPAIISGEGIFETRSMRFQERGFTNYQLAGEHVLGENGIRIDWAGSAVKVTSDSPNFRTFTNTVLFDADGKPNYDLNRSEVPLPTYFFRNLEDNQYTGKVDLTIPLGGDSKANKVQFGGFYSNKDRVFRDDVYQMQIGRNATSYEGDPTKFFASENVGIVGFDERRNINEIGLFPTNFAKATAENSYDGQEKVAAGYGMLVYDWDVLKVIAGARVEYTDIFVKSQAETLPEGAINQVDVLPSLNLIYKLSENVNLRATATQTLARPNMRELAPFESFDFAGDFRVIGNPDLQRTLIQNYDFRYEFYPNPGEIIAASVYYKNFNNPIVTAFKLQADNLIEYQNVDEANVYGLELEFRKNLGFLGNAFENFKFSSNLSIIQSQVDIAAEELDFINTFNPEKGTTRPFQGQSPFLLNAALNYVDRDNGWDAIVSFNVFGERLDDISRGPVPDIFEQPRPQLDFSLSKSLTENFGIRVRANNLLNPNTTTLMRFSGEDYLIRDFQRGTSFGLSLTYKI